MGANQPFPPFESQTAAPAIVYATAGVQPPAALAVSVNDQFVFNVWSISSVVINVFARVLLPNGFIVPIEQTIQTDGLRDQQQFNWPLTDGFLLSAAAYVTAGGQNRGAIYAQFQVFRGSIGQGFSGLLLASNYITFNTALAWPGGVLDYGMSGRGNLRKIAGTTPAAGAEVNEGPPSLAFWRLVSFAVTFTTSATVANRLTTFRIGRGPSAFQYQASRSAADAAGVTVTNVLSPAPYAGGTGANIMNVPLPPDLYVFGNMTIATLTQNIQAGDQYGTPQYEVEEWLQP